MNRSGRAPIGTITIPGPLGIAGLRLWYDLSHCTQAGGIVTALPDQSGNGYDAIIVGGTEPSYTAANALFGSLPTMDFPAVNTKYVSHPAVVSSTTNAYTIVLVCNSALVGSYVWSNHSGGVFIYHSGTNVAMYAGTTVAGGVAATPNVTVAVFNGASSTLYVSAKTAVASGNPGTVDLNGSPGGRLGQFGNAGGAPNVAWDQTGSTAHFCMYNRAISAAEAATLLTYFGGLAGISIGA